MKTINEYQGVKIEKRIETPDKYLARLTYEGVNYCEIHETALDAAIAYDMMRIARGLNPVNELTGDVKVKTLKTINLLYTNGCSLFNDCRKEITKYIKEGRTKLFDSELDALCYSRKVGSYPYSVYNEYNESVGFAVPK